MLRWQDPYSEQFTKKVPSLEKHAYGRRADAQCQSGYQRAGLPAFYVLTIRELCPGAEDRNVGGVMRHDV